VVNQAEVAYREFLGRNRVPLPPGLHLNLPILHTLWRVDMRERSVGIGDITGFTKDNVPIVVSCVC
jgi:regulator of protease activity HflC (stomatin/prohibitin superfamily)